LKKKDEEKPDEKPIEDDFVQLFDAETGDPIGITSSVWTSQEGRLNIDMPSILGIATGAFDIKRRVAAAHNIEGKIFENPSNFTENSSKHPLVEKFLKEGPLTPIYHKLWTPKSGLSSTISEAERNGKVIFHNSFFSRILREQI